ncbi:MAG: hypothetical protein QE263_06485 [Vampirovibrionales bacterium]|nr:hypothetical protein [Vampirovibrionales bacterium]
MRIITPTFLIAATALLGPSTAYAQIPSGTTLQQLDADQFTPSSISNLFEVSKHNPSVVRLTKDSTGVYPLARALGQYYAPLLGFKPDKFLQDSTTQNKKAPETQFLLAMIKSVTTQNKGHEFFSEGTTFQLVQEGTTCYVKVTRPATTPVAYNIIPTRTNKIAPPSEGTTPPNETLMLGTTGTVTFGPDNTITPPKGQFDINGNMVVLDGQNWRDLMRLFAAMNGTPEVENPRAYFSDMLTSQTDSWLKDKVIKKQKQAAMVRVNTYDDLFRQKNLFSPSGDIVLHEGDIILLPTLTPKGQ